MLSLNIDSLSHLPAAFPYANMLHVHPGCQRSRKNHPHHPTTAHSRSSVSNPVASFNSSRRCISVMYDRRGRPPLMPANMYPKGSSLSNYPRATISREGEGLGRVGNAKLVSEGFFVAWRSQESLLYTPLVFSFGGSRPSCHNSRR
jgi:hypothetical protein